MYTLRKMVGLGINSYTYCTVGTGHPVPIHGMLSVSLSVK